MRRECPWNARTRPYGRRVMYNEVIADFAWRTKQNLDFIQKGVHGGQEGLFEVTQLWNSLLGLIVLPLETDKKNGDRHIPATPMSELATVGWPRLSSTGGNDETLHELLWNIRHAVAHANVEFLAQSPGSEIGSVKLWNERSGKRVWDGQVTVSELRRFVGLIADLYQTTFAKKAA
jgi:hypothetical protein